MTTATSKVSNVRQVYRQLAPASLKLHPVSVSVYGGDPSDEIVASIREQGIIQPLVLAADNKTVVSGRRRRAAAMTLKMQVVPCMVRTDLIDDLDIREAIIESNTVNEKTPEQRAREFAERKAIESERAARRMKSGKKSPEAATDAAAAVGKASDIAAEAVGWSPATAERAASVVKKADELKKTSPKLAEVVIDTLNNRNVNAAARVLDVAQKSVEKGQDIGPDELVERADKKTKAPTKKSIVRALSAFKLFVRCMPKDLHTEIKNYVEIIYKKLQAYEE